MSQGRLVAGVVLFAAVFAGCGGGGNDGTSSADNGTTGWSSLPVNIYADPSVANTTGAQQDFQSGIAFWEAKAGRKLFNFLGTWTGSTPYTSSGGTIQTVLNNVIIIQNPWPFASNLAGQTTVEWAGSQINAAVVMINADVPMCAGDCSTGDVGATSQLKAITHELGHFLGLAHVQDTSNIMYPQIQPGYTLDGLTIDQNALNTLTQGR